MISCHFCSQKYKNRNGLAQHIKIHGISLKEYYDKYLDPSDHTCPICNSAERKWYKSNYMATCCNKRCSYELRKRIWNDKTETEKQEDIKKKINVRNQKSSYEKRLIKIKREDTCISRYGVSNNSKTAEAKLNLSNKAVLQHSKTLDERNEKWNREVGSIFNLKRLSQHVFRCLCCDEVFIVTGSFECPRCSSLVASSFNSLFEKNVYDFLSKTFSDIEFKINDRRILSGLELDFYCDEIKVAIECDGTYWHADKRFYESDEEVHGVKACDIWLHDENKDKMCNELNIKLFRISEYDWKTTNDLVKNKIKDFINEQIKS